MVASAGRYASSFSHVANVVRRGSLHVEDSSKGMKQPTWRGGARWGSLVRPDGIGFLGQGQVDCGIGPAPGRRHHGSALVRTAG